MSKSLTAAKLDLAISRAVSELENHDVSSEAYATCIDRIAKLSKLKEAETPPRNQLSRDTLALCLTNVLGIVMIIRHEQVNFIASKAFGTLMRTR